MNYKMKHKSLIALLTPLLFTLGCTSSPPVIKASVALIDKPIESNKVDALPSELDKAVQGRPQGYVSIYNGTMMLLGKKYTSALGTQCRIIYLSDENNKVKKERRTVCKNEKTQQWSMAPQVIENKNNQISFGV
ncbi:hypothetical protein [Pseudoalteromonas atlantica]|uniref:hypothetical protein n=1 Tax=Pseudoalteromonas atlantica TaxID=288 RepID=UPI001E33ABDB|nr:hypothetical protein [Pseudoalteromonas atlantica]